MKLFIINGENNDEKIEIHINKSLMVKDIKYKLDQSLHGNGIVTNNYYRLIHKNTILWTDGSINCYKICENDEIWFGKIENYLRKDDIIVHVFIWGPIVDVEYLIVKMNDKISRIRSIIEKIYSAIINIWNVDGKQMKNDQFVTEIGTNENYKLIIRCANGEGNEINNTFDKCCYLYDRFWVDQYLLADKFRDDNKNESTRAILINIIDEIRQTISSNDTIDDRLNQNLSDLPSSFRNLTRLFCFDMTDRIVDICNDYWLFEMNQYGYNAVSIFHQYFHDAIQTALWNFSIIRQQINNKINKSMSDIVIDALDIFLKYLIDSSNDWHYWLRLWMNQYLLRPFSDSDLNKRIDKCKINKLTIKMGMNENDLIENKPNDDDKFDNEFINEIMLSMDDIELLRSLVRGGFARIYLCRDKISNKKFVLKKAIRNDGDLYRDINIYSKLNSSSNIMNYSELFRDGESICIGMEYMSGRSLRSYLDKGKYLSEQEIMKILYEILIQINELHKLGIIHRDIKSGKIVLDEYNHAKLIGFGISKYTIGLTSKDLLDELKVYVPETICYMAPELIKKEPYSEKIDIWSFGMVMVEMVTGKRPFHWLKPFQAVLKIRDCTKYEFEPIFPISNELNQFINSCLNTNPDKRLSAEQLIKSELFIDYLNKIQNV